MRTALPVTLCTRAREPRCASTGWLWGRRSLSPHLPRLPLDGLPRGARRCSQVGSGSSRSCIDDCQEKRSVRESLFALAFDDER